MNTPNKNKNCKVDNSYCRFGAEIILKLTDNFFELIEGVIADRDIEYVHKTRVISRRLRAALPIFQECLSKKQFKMWTQKIKKITHLLSSVRDLDVQIEFIEQYIKKLTSPTEKSAILLLLKDQKTSRENIQSAVKNGLDELEASAVLGNIREVCKQIVIESHIASDLIAVTQQAQRHISKRLDNFLSMQQYVKIEGADPQHHKMRIYAKKLRYTMEIFASLYPNELKKEIDIIKMFQDELGELHDCTVWVECIPKFQKNRVKVDTVALDQALENFSAYIQQKKEDHYHRFVELWVTCNNSGLFEQIRKTTSLIVLSMTQEKNKEKPEMQNVRVAILSDIHANLPALQRVLEDAEQRGVQVFLNAGDSIGYGASPNEVVEMLCQKNVVSILGNYDLEVLENKNDAKSEKHLAFEYAKKTLSSTSKSYLEVLSLTMRLQTANKKLLLTHGSPKSINEHIYHNTPESRLKELSDQVDADIIIVGHSHEQFLRIANGVHFINPGSVGRQSDGTPQAAYAILDFNPVRVQLIRLDYPVEDAAQELRNKGLPESYSQMLLRGISIDEVLKLDRNNKKAMVQNCRGIVIACEEFSKNLWPDIEHYLQVTNLSLALFDGVKSLHKLGGQERCWLECAAVLHDIGFSIGVNKHNKKSAQIILNDTALPFSSSQRRIIAALTRYHRKGLPSPRQYLFAPLNRQIFRKINMLAAILRVADSLDYTHKSAVKILGIRVTPKTVTAECFTNTDLTLEQQAFNKKKNLFEKTFDREMMLEWKQP